MNSKKINKLKLVLIILWGLVIISSFFYFYTSYNKHAVKELGNKATIAAIALMDHFPIEDDQKEKILSYTFDELLKSEENISYENKARKMMAVSNIKYIYVQKIIPEEKVKYFVTEQNKNYYNAEPGTPLNVIYYLDGVVDDQTRWEDTKGNWYKDQDRYTVLKDDLLEVYTNKESKVFLNNDEWGSYISSYVPLISDSGKVFGVMGADLFLDSFKLFSKENNYFFGGLVLVNIILLFLVFFFSNKKRELDLRLEETLKISSTDFLTKVMNRKRFMDILSVKYETAVKGNLKFSFVFIDVDFFKEYNDYYGHQAGDLVLYKVGKILMKITERFSGIVGRYGGDEFTLAFLGIGEEEIAKIINEIFYSVEELNIKNEFLGKDTLQTVSVGTSFLNNENPSSIEQLISNADEALYMSKNHGRNMAHIHNGVQIKKLKRY